MFRRGILLVVLTAAFVGAPFSAFAADASSAHYILRDPVIDGSGGFSSSPSFQLFSSQDFIANGTSTSASFESRYGFLPFPVVTPPSLSATLTATDTASLSWSPSVGYLGWTVAGYSVAQSTNANGPFAYTSVGNTLTTSASGLLAGTTYYFAVVAQDTFGNFIGTSSVASVVTPGTGDDDDNDSGGGAQSNTRPTSNTSGVARISGYGHPNGMVFILADGVRVQEITTGDDGHFSSDSITLPFGAYIVSIYGVDHYGRRSSLLSFPVTLSTLNRSISLSDIFIPPTIALEQLPDGTVRMSGSTLPDASVTTVLTVPSAVPVTAVLQASASGDYSGTLTQQALLDGSATLRTFAALGTLTSPFSYSLRFTDVLATNTPAPPVRGDLNNDGRVNLIDFSVLAYWYHRSGVPARYDLNNDGQIGISDFSILAFYWSG